MSESRFFYRRELMLFFLPITPFHIDTELLCEVRLRSVSSHKRAGMPCGCEAEYEIRSFDEN
jgi:hypothetical protein